MHSIFTSNASHRSVILPTLLCAIILLNVIQACSSTQTVVSPEVSKSVSVDGDLTDWPHTEALLKESNGFNYYAMHDETNLYVYVNIKNSRFKRLVENTGLTIYISGNKKNKKALGITYPVGAYNFLKEMPAEFRKFKQNAKWLKKPENQKLLEELSQDNYKKALITQRHNRKETAQEVIIDLTRLEAQGIKVARKQLHNRLQLELSIPLKSTKTQQLAVVPTNDRMIQLGFTVSPPENKWNNQSTTVDLSRQRPNRGRYGRRRDRGQMEERLKQLSDAQDNWFKIKLGSTSK